MFWFRFVIGLALVGCLAPLASTALAGAIAEVHGCRLHEGFANTCMIGGADWGQTLYTMGMMGWFMIATLPIGATLVALWIAVELIRAVRVRRSGARR